MRKVEVRATLRAEREVRDCVATGELPALALAEVRSAYGYCTTSVDDLFLWSDLVGAMERAVKFADVDHDGVYGRLLPDVLKRMRRLVAMAEEAMRHEECFA